MTRWRWWTRKLRKSLMPCTNALSRARYPRTRTHKRQSAFALCWCLASRSRNACTPTAAFYVYTRRALLI
jgi:hypothetical protein